MKINKPDNEWRTKLPSEQYRVCRKKGTEVPFYGNIRYLDPTVYIIVFAVDRLLGLTH